LVLLAENVEKTQKLIKAHPITFLELRLVKVFADIILRLLVVLFDHFELVFRAIMATVVLLFSLSIILETGVVE
jgi:hypothetical protein